MPTNAKKAKKIVVNTQNTNFWNSSESIVRYSQMEYGLWDSELALLNRALSKMRWTQTSQINVLDLGCGGGRTTVPLFNLGFNVIGVDISKELIQLLKKNHPKIRSLVGDACSLQFPRNHFDIVLFSHNSIDYLYPISARLKALKEVYRVLKPGGYFIFSSHTFNPIPVNPSILSNIVSNFFSYITSPFSGYYNERMKNGEQVTTFYAVPSVVKKQLESIGFSLEYGTRLIQGDPSLIRSFIKGLVSWEIYYLAKKLP